MERWGGGIMGGGGPFGGGPGDFNDESGEQFLGQWAVIEKNWKTIVTRSLEPARGPTVPCWSARTTRSCRPS